MMTKSKLKLLADIFTYVVLILGAIIMFVPFLWMISVSFREPAQQFSRNFIPNPITFENYIQLFKVLPDNAFTFLTFNSFKLSILMVIGQTITCAMAAFVFAIA
jgi:multiple sugar transport system permease protein